MKCTDESEEIERNEKLNENSNVNHSCSLREEDSKTTRRRVVVFCNSTELN